MTGSGSNAARGALIAAMLWITAPASAAPACQTNGTFDRWLVTFRQDAATQGISAAALSAGLDGIAFDRSVIARDRGQGVFQQPFLQFQERMAGVGRYQNGLRQIKANAALLQRIEQRTGVPPAVVVALWGLESDYGAYQGAKFNIIQAVATLAYDCRRSEFFRGQLMDALRLVQRGDLRPSEMLGNWAGELGPTQFVPSGYFKYGIDMDGDGRVDMIRSTADALGSAANMLAGYGWKRGQPWLQEVRVPAQLGWEQAGVDITHPRSQWVRWGVQAAHGALPADAMPASLILPMGRNGPAFLAYANFQAFSQWNSAIVYSTTAAYFATRLAGAPPVGRGNAPVAPLTTDQVKELQRQLIARKYISGEADGKIGSQTRSGVKQAQIKLGMPADSYPSPELIERLRGR